MQFTRQFSLQAYIKNIKQLKMLRLNKNTASLIKSQHSYSSVLSIVKELVENALDAQSTKIVIRLTENSVTTQDDGCGIHNFDILGEEGCTSKSDELDRIFSPNATTKYYGFRGMAIFTLSKISQLTIESKEIKKDFYKGEITSSIVQKGTIIYANDIFYNVPVRRKLLNVKKELSQISELIKSYLLVNNVIINLYYFDKLILSKIPDLQYKILENRKFTIKYSKENFGIFLFYLNKPIIDNKIKRMIHALTKTTFILIIKEKCDINTAGKNEVLIRNREIFIKELKDAIKELINEETYTMPSPKSSPVKRIKDDIIKEHKFDEFEIIKKEIPENLTQSNPINLLNSSRINLIGKIKENLPMEATNNRFLSLNDNAMLKEPPSVAIDDEAKIADHTSTELKIMQEEKPCSDHEEGDISDREYEEKVCFKSVPYCEKLDLKKSDFKEFKIIGQFNSGFILCSFLNNKIVIDQHAASEIKNYEKLKNEFSLNKNLLLKPILINLNEIDLMFIADNLEVFNKNGFTVENSYLMTLPTYKGIEFTYKDFLDFVDDLKMGNEFCTKYNEILKYKACRMSVMIGEKLKYNQMIDIVNELSYLDKPWWCPHGRPVCRVIETEKDI
ncbi:hypothetical protein H312_03392 [Anncaliia algerae PRA339]|uniref:MutL C-terminal dimerisation domain-containing protein n=1 Tax=Anncaliia algerae PRA339 TaxID=1288291 RepID=A0A059EW06_9MICR|nr:hypothetical protein H312_03392 [Anncaliia algerae PRA339]